MNLPIRSCVDTDIEDIVELSLLAWEPVFDSFKNVLGPKIFPILYPDWRVNQKEGVSKVCQDRGKYTTWVVEVGNRVVGFISYELDHHEKTGEVMLLAVHPDYQNQEIGTELNNFALDKMVESGMKLAVVGTGGDEGHAPARRSYEKAGYTPLPLVRYYQALPPNQIEPD